MQQDPKRKHPVVVVGAGKIGEMICDFLYHSGDYHISLVDQNKARLQQLKDRYANIDIHAEDIQASAKLDALLAGKFAVLNACPFDLTVAIAESAKRNNVHYLDLTEDVASTKEIKAIAKGASTAFIPQCGLAPGFISIAAYDIAKHFDELHRVHMRVGALPKYPSNALKYNLTWSTDGLINEYLKPCEAIVNGQLTRVPPMEELEHFALDGDDYEAFNTSGGLGTLCETLKGKVDFLNYRTVRYPGHRDLMQVLLKDLRLSERPALLKQILESAIPVTLQDVVLIFVSVSGQKEGKYIQETYAKKVYSQEIQGIERSAIQVTTAASICTTLDLLAHREIPNQGFVRQEDIPYQAFIKNRFGRYFDSQKIKTSGPQKEVA